MTPAQALRQAIDRWLLQAIASPKSTAQSVLTVTIAVTGILVAHPPPHLGANAAWLLFAIPAAAKLFVGGAQNDGKPAATS